MKVFDTTSEYSKSNCMLPLIKIEYLPCAFPLFAEDLGRPLVEGIGQL